MAITFYQQKRYDGGIRSGIDVHGLAVHQEYREGSADRDNALLWYLDVRCDGDAIPDDPAEAIDWLKRHCEEIGNLIETAADELAVGLDNDVIPFRREIALGQPPASVSIAVSCVRRLRAGELSLEVRRIGAEWKSLISNIDSNVASSLNQL